MKTVRCYYWQPDIIIIDLPYAKQKDGYKLLLSDNNMKVFSNGIVSKIWFNPEKFPNFEYIAAQFSISKRDDMAEIIAALLFYKRTGNGIPIKWTKHGYQCINDLDNYIENK